MKNDYKNTTISGHEFRIGRMSAMTGARVLNLLLSAIMQSPTKEDSKPGAEPELESLSAEEKANNSIAAMWMIVGSMLSEEAYIRVQRAALQVCMFFPVPDSPGIPVLSVNGKWAATEIETDIPTVNQLIVQALQFNLAPFFIESALRSEAAAAQEQKSASPIVTGSSSARL